MTYWLRCTRYLWYLLCEFGCDHTEFNDCQFVRSDDAGLAIIVSEGFVYFYVISLVFSRNIAKRIYGRYMCYIDNMAGAVFLFFGLLLIYSGINEMIH